MYSVSKIQAIKDKLQYIERELEALKVFRLTPQMKKFQRALLGEQSFVKNELKKLSATKATKEKLRTETIKLANKNRSEKMKRTWRYIKAIQKNYPTKLSLRELRTALRKHRQGLDTDISDVAWRNPSP